MVGVPSGMAVMMLRQDRRLFHCRGRLLRFHRASCHHYKCNKASSHGYGEGFDRSAQGSLPEREETEILCDYPDSVLQEVTWVSFGLPVMLIVLVGIVVYVHLNAGKFL